MDPTRILQRIAAGRTDLILDRLADGGSADARVDGASLLQWSAYYGDVTALRVLMERGQALSELGDDLGLNGAAFHGHWRLVQFLVEQGAPTDHALSDTGETALHAALCHDERIGRDRVLKVLLDAGADVHAKTLVGQPTGGFMRDARTRGETALHRAALVGTPDTLRLLLDAGAQVEVRDAHGDTPLAWASWARRPPAVLHLLCYGEHRVRENYAGMAIHLSGEPLKR
ncbi:ankyrin repeat domain-containing protein [Pelomonas sp. SE-A7]|uniref:ankyrin repeat domain-containing protein n=1 Tax=Pelomonas sp. SE-A7 TaxID=3054953 RepID=UPI00259CAA13|nr:ankyrin repeat domain-containing protein [Pelomonas sp. SE-A7]MDM4768532.1 ankyrin repeat domain-containing protein [Pelomonas sp. SE-A7]